MDRPVIKDQKVLQYVEELEFKLKKYEESPLIESYIACLETVNRWNRQLMETEVSLFTGTEDKSFDRAHKYLTEQRPYIEQLEYLRKLMNPEQQKEIEKMKKLDGVGMATKIALNNKNGG